MSVKGKVRPRKIEDIGVTIAKIFALNMLPDRPRHRVDQRQDWPRADRNDHAKKKKFDDKMTLVFQFQKAPA